MMAIAGGSWLELAVLVVSILVAGGLQGGLIIAYLRNVTAESNRRHAAHDRAIGELRQSQLASAVSASKEFASKEEWLREAMHARQKLDTLTEMVAGLTASVNSGMSVASQLRPVLDAMVEATRAAATTAGGGHSSGEAA